MENYLENEEIYGIHTFLEDIVPSFLHGNMHNMSEKEINQAVKDLLSFYNDNNLFAPCFEDVDFLLNLINNVDVHDIPKYMVNTDNYLRHKEYDKKYVLCFRRAVPSDSSKPETFWSTEFNTVKQGLRYEIGIGSPQRLHSVINIATLDSLEQHGIVHTMGRGVSDGEVAINPNKDFSSFLFRYKPISEFFSLRDYIANGGIERDELLHQLAETSLERMRKQGLIVDENMGDVYDAESMWDGISWDDDSWDDDSWDNSKSVDSSHSHK